MPPGEADKVPAREGGAYSASGSNAWEAAGGRLAKQPRSTNTEDREGGHSFSNADRTDPATQERVQYQRAGPPGQLLH